MPTLVRTSTIKRDRFVTGRSKSRTRNMMARKRTRRYSRYAKSTFAKRVRKIVETDKETKFRLVVPFPGTVITATPTVFNTISDIAQGTTENLRIGDTIKPKHIDLSFVFTNVNDVTTYVRISVVAIYKQSATADYATTDKWFNDPIDQHPESYSGIQASNTATAGNWAAFTSKYDPSAVKTIFNRYLKLSKNGFSERNNVMRFKHIVPLKGVIKYDGAAGGALLQTKRYYLICTCFNSVAPSSVNAQGYAVLRYTDS